MTLLLSAHLGCAAAAVLMFWSAAATDKGDRVHRAVGRWFARATYGAAATGGALALIGLARPALLPLAADSNVPLVPARHLLWLTLYLLVVIVAPVQHGLAAIAAGPLPARARSAVHLGLNLALLAGALMLFPASIVWREWWFLLAGPAGFVVGLRNMSYASRAAAAEIEWQREHLTSLITAGIAVHTAGFVLSVTRWPALAGGGSWTWAVWLGPALVGVPAIWLLRRRWRLLRQKT